MNVAKFFATFNFIVMTGKKVFFPAFVVAFFCSFVFSETAVAKPQTKSLRLGLHESSTRFVIEISEKITFSTSQNKEEIIISVPALVWNAPFPRAVGHVKSIKYADSGKKSGKITLLLSKKAIIEKSFLIPPRDGYSWRLVIDMKSSQTTPEVASPVKPPAPGTTTATTSPKKASPDRTQATAPPPPAKKKSIPVIAIDAGHGGADPGAIGVSGAYEKNITLAFAREAQTAFKKQGRYKVILTRSRDIFIPLRDRIAIARAQGADLFISLHADSTKNSATRGMSVYTLSKTASDAEAAALAEKENKADLIAGMDLSHESAEVANILIDLAQRESMNLSASYASMLIDEAGRETSLLNNTHRFAGFAVLKAPDVPSVLWELGYLSNKNDERLLRQQAYRATLINALMRSVDRFFMQEQKARKP